MKVILGLGNPGKQYELTRHNIGRRIIEAYAAEEGVALRKRGIFGLFRSITIAHNQQNITLAVPSVYMNISGKAVSDAVKRFGIPLENLLILCDDIQLPFGHLRIRSSGSSGGHNGLASVIRVLGTSEFSRLRIGIDKPLQGVDLADYVLKRFTSEEEHKLAGIIQESIAACKLWVEYGIQKTMERVN